ncbi:hypothetical protein PM082_014803 [Marasmius tenuissimus]|nr:hypothetical protein PM082_014803 [Marasmius tenuissimus]
MINQHLSGGVSKSGREILVPLFARVHIFQCRVPDEAGNDGDGELLISVALYKLEAVEERSEDQTDADHIPAPPAGFDFVCTHDPDSEVVLTGNCLVGRCCPENIAGELLENHVSLVGRNPFLERLDHFEEMQGLQRSEPEEDGFTSQCIFGERGSTSGGSKISTCSLWALERLEWFLGRYPDYL